jgi:hypothetical protein
MFGRGRKSKSSNEKFVISKGVDAGNLKGRGTAEKTAPTSKPSPLGLPNSLFTETRGNTLTRKGWK